MLRVAGAGLLIAAGAIHLDLYLTGYRTIPTIGWLFLLQVTSKALPDTEIDAAIDPVAVSPTSTAATAAAGIIRIAKRRHRTFPVVATWAGWAGGVAGVSGDGSSTDMTLPATFSRCRRPFS
jgi:hypothetical protein